MLDLTKLNPQQLLAVETIDGPVMVMAGPGTGKTQVLAMRIANILAKTDTPPSSILALTFTDAAAVNMKQRLTTMIGPQAHKVHVSTFHAFCQQVVEDNKSYFSLSRQAQPLSDLEKIGLIKQLIDEVNDVTIRPLKKPYLYVKDMIDLISSLKREGVEIADLINKLDEYEQQPLPEGKRGPSKSALAEKASLLARLRGFTKIYEKYQAHLVKTDRCDYEDMIGWVLSAFKKHADLLADYQERYLYILVDEYQDSNGAQNQVVDLLASFWQDQANVFVVGDPHQSIFRFQGASLANTWSFVNRYPSAKVITLKSGYRCPQNIYDLAHGLVKDINLATDIAPIIEALSEKLLAATKGQHQALSFHVLKNQEEEKFWLLSEIQTLLAKGVKPHEIAILTKTNEHAIGYVNFLHQFSIPANRVGGENLLEVPVVRQVIQLLSFLGSLEKAQEDEHIFDVMCQPWFALPASDILLVSREAGQSKTTWFEYLQSIVKPEAIKAWWQKMLALAAKSHQLGLSNFIQHVFQETNLISWLLTNGRPNELSYLSSFFKQAEDLNSQNTQVSLVDFLRLLSAAADQPKGLQVDYSVDVTNMVAVSTIFKAKGLEWEYVFVPAQTEKNWKPRRKNNLHLPVDVFEVGNNVADLADELADQRRLLYVAITRAKKHTYLSYAGALNMQGKAKEQIANQFWYELLAINPGVEQVKEEKIEILPQQLATTLLPTASVSNDEKLKKYLHELLASFVLSPTALNKYLSDPKDFWLNHVIRIPQQKSANMIYGTAIHYLLEMVGTTIKNNQPLPSPTQMSKWVNFILENQLRDEPSLPDWQKKAEQIITAIAQGELDINAQKVIDFEVKVGSSSLPIQVGQARIGGKIDRIDWWQDRKEELLVVDYKTGEPKSANAIEGKTQDKNRSDREEELPIEIKGSYKRQLLFYKLLCQHSTKFKQPVTQGLILYVESKTNKMTYRYFDLLDEDVALLEKLIQEVWQEINELKGIESIFISK